MARRLVRSHALTGLVTAGVVLAALGPATSSGAAAPSADESGRAPSYASTPTRAEEGINPTTLPKGPAPMRVYLVGRTIHPKPGKGKPFTIQLAPATARFLTLLGNSPRGYVVSYEKPNGFNRIYVVRSTGKQRGKAVMIRSAVADYVLSHDGTRLLERRKKPIGSGDYTVVYTVYGIDGPLHAQLSGDDLMSEDNLLNSQVADFDGRRTVLVDDSGGFDWTIGEPVRSLDDDYRYADIAHDLLFAFDPGPLTDGGGAYKPTVGPTSLDDPGTLRWKVRGDRVVKVSPDGKLVATSIQDQRYQSYPTLDVRTTSNGASRSKRVVVYDDLVWEGNTHLLFLGYNPNTGKSTIVRCAAVGGACKRTTAVFPASANVSLSTQ